MPFLITPSAPMTTGTICVFLLYILAILTSRSLYLEKFSATLTDMLWSDGTAMSSSIHNFSFLLLIIVRLVGFDGSIRVDLHIPESITSSFSVTLLVI